MKRFLAFFTLLIFGLGWLLGWSPYLRIESIAVTGLATNSPLTQERIIATSGVIEGMALARVSEPAVRRALARIPRIGDVDVVRSWPASVELRISEREPWAIVKVRDSLHFVDRDGTFFAKVGTPASAIPVVVMDSLVPDLVQDLVVVVDALPLSLRSRIEGLSALSDDQLIVNLRNGAEVLAIEWGSVSETPFKVRVLRELLAQNEASRWRAVDISAPRAPTTR